MNIAEIRKSFPNIKAGQIYFNHASLGPLSVTVKEIINSYFESRSLNLKQSFDVFLEADKSAKLRLGGMLNCRPNQLSWIGNVSDAMNVLVNGIDWETGDRVILNDIEFPANVYPFLNLKSKGVEVDLVKSRNGIIKLEDIFSAVTEKTKLISISLVQFLSGFRTDIIELGMFCKEHGIIFSVDAIQAAGVVNTDVQEANVDFLAGGAHKWLMSLTGTSYLYISDKLNRIFKLSNVGWLSVKDPWHILDYNLELKPDAEKFQTGTMNVTGIVALNKSLEMFESVGFNNIEKLVLANTNYFIEKLTGIGIEPLLKNLPNKNKAGIVSFYVEKPERVLLSLQKKNIIGEIREGLIRMSPHFYNTKKEIKTVVNSISELI